ncbi:DNA polymerase III subunit epsilon [Candidatus Aerophobetes bacterium]|uniref:DNA polymerase III subunit epsilon n=1 Tax=Aerophobetes bacterium TaxID=2030807 RepID=A0A2A4WXC4_UNCAE|nr:MAG: DNA polymerase III subunit epsilon [Candidatus Aerophobetes bacterium]
MLGIFLDIEANGLDMDIHKPLSIAIKIVNLTTGSHLAFLESMINISSADWERSSPESLNINGIKKDMLQEAPTIENVKANIVQLFTKLSIDRKTAVFICQNPSFDRAFFHKIISATEQEAAQWPYHWLDLASMFWSKQMAKAPPFPWDFGISKNSIAATYHLSKETLPHTAMGGVDHLIKCYQAVVGFPSLKN